MAVLIRPEDWTATVWQWTMTLYINRSASVTCRLDVPLEKNGRCPRKLDLYACTEGFGWGARKGGMI